MKHLVLGHGEVGAALVELLKCDWSDVGMESVRNGRPDVLHVAIPYGPQFAGAVCAARDRFAPTHVVVHSTVPVGTCEAMGAIHSPVRGVHPHLLEGLRTFVKYFGGPGAPEVARAWPGRDVHILPDARTCEALKLWDTTQYGAHIRLMQEIHRYCVANGVDFEIVYRHANWTYNDGYCEMGKPTVIRPLLFYNGPDIGGHCVLPNAKLLGGPVAALVAEGFK